MELAPKTITRPSILQSFKDDDSFIQFEDYIEACIKKYERESRSGTAPSDGFAGGEVAPPPEEYERVDVTKSDLDQLYRELMVFKDKKAMLLALEREFHKEQLATLNQMKLPELSRITAQYLNIDVPAHTCDLCRVFTAHTAKGIATHKRTCAKRRELREEETA